MECIVQTTHCHHRGRVQGFCSSAVWLAFRLPPASKHLRGHNKNIHHTSGHHPTAKKKSSYKRKREKCNDHMSEYSCEISCRVPISPHCLSGFVSFPVMLNSSRHSWRKDSLSVSASQTAALSHSTRVLCDPDTSSGSAFLSR